MQHFNPFNKFKYKWSTQTENNSIRQNFHNVLNIITCNEEFHLYNFLVYLIDMVDGDEQYCLYSPDDALIVQNIYIDIFYLFYCEKYIKYILGKVFLSS